MYVHIHTYTHTQKISEAFIPDVPCGRPGLPPCIPGGDTGYTIMTFKAIASGVENMSWDFL